MTGSVASLPSERAAPALWGGNLLEFPRGLGQFQLSFPTEPRCQMRSSGKSQRQSSAPLFRDHGFRPNQCGKCRALAYTHIRNAGSSSRREKQGEEKRVNKESEQERTDQFLLLLALISVLAIHGKVVEQSI